MGIKEGEEKESTEEIFETIVTEHFTELILDTNPQIKEAQRIPSRIMQKKKKLKNENEKEKEKERKGKERRGKKGKERHANPNLGI